MVKMQQASEKESILKVYPEESKSGKDQFELEQEIEQLKWQLTSADINRIEIQTEKDKLARDSVDVNQQLESAELQIVQLEESNRKHQADYF